MNETYDYSSYSLEQLLDAQNHINRELYPERAAEIDRWVLRRSAERATAHPSLRSVEATAVPNQGGRPFLACGIAVMFAVLILGSIVAVLIMRGRGHDASSKEAALAVVKAVTRDWNPEELRKNASEEFKPVASGPSIERAFKLFRQLGNLISLGEATGSSRATAGFGSVRSGITAEWAFPAKFAHGDATVRVMLIREGGQWKTQGFFINSEAFLPK